jgi:TetR/AcrR family transcriptional regulator, repressor of fatR-cypB operon
MPRSSSNRSSREVAPASRRNPAPSSTSLSDASDEKREAILDAALDLFSERGFYGTAVPLLAENAKVATGTIYRYFENKEAIVNALYRREKQLLGTALLEAFPFDAPPRDQFHYFWTAAMKYARQHPTGLAFLELHHHQTYLDDACRELEAQILSPAYAFFTMTAEKKVTKAYSPVVLGSIVWGAFVGMVRAGWEKRMELTDEVIEQGENCVWEAIRR